MSLLKILFILSATVFLLSTSGPRAFAEVEVDFSFLDDDPNTTTSAPTDRKQTEANAGCITCAAKNKKPSKNLQDNVDVAKTGMKQNAKSTKKNKKIEDCIGCGRDNNQQSTASSNGSSSSRGSGDWSQFPGIAAYSNSPKVSRMIAWARNHSFSSSKTACYRYVKEALCGAKRPVCRKDSMVSGYPNGNPVFADRPSSVPRSKRIGVNAIKTLEDQGFKNLLTNPATKDLIKNPASAPKGAILIYTGGHNGGHIEIKTGDGNSGSYISDFSAPKSVLQNALSGRASKHYQLVGVMVKENP